MYLPTKENDFIFTVIIDNDKREINNCMTGARILQEQEIINI